MKKLLLLILSLPFFIQGLKAQSKDSTQCFTAAETRQIADIILQGDECAQLLGNAKKEIENRVSFIVDQELKYSLLKEVVQQKDSININSAEQITAYKKLLKKENRKKKWVKVGWISSVAILGALLVLKK